jgi:hypothetical protein
MVSKLTYWLFFQAVIQLGLAKPVTHAYNLDTNSNQDSNLPLGNVIRRQAPNVADPRCGAAEYPGATFTKRLGQIAIDAFCDGLAGKGPNPWQDDKEVVVGWGGMQFSTTHHFDDTLFDFQVEAYYAGPKTAYRFSELASPSYYNDCKGAFRILTTICK